MKLQCKWKYFKFGFKNAFNLFGEKVEFEYYCPHCCEKMTKSEYFSGLIFTYGCTNCYHKIQQENFKLQQKESLDDSLNLYSGLSVY